MNKLNKLNKSKEYINIMDDDFIHFNLIPGIESASGTNIFDFSEDIDAQNNVNETHSSSSSICQEADEEVFNILNNINLHQNSQPNSFKEGDFIMRSKNPIFSEYCQH